MNTRNLIPEQVTDLAWQALDQMMSVPFDSFGPIDACRMLPGFLTDQLTDLDRASVIEKLRELCGGAA